MAAEKLDKLWGGWVKALSGSHVKTLRLLEAGKTSDAGSEFKQTFHTVVKKVYSEAACTAPKRFAASKDWCAWLRRLYALSVKTNKALRKASNTTETHANAREEAASGLRALRGCFHVLHTETKTLTVNDHIYGFYQEVAKEKPSVSELGRLRTALDQTATDNGALREATTAWKATVDPLLSDGMIQAQELELLRAATTILYRAHGEAIPPE